MVFNSSFNKKLYILSPLLQSYLQKNNKSLILKEVFHAQATVVKTYRNVLHVKVHQQNVTTKIKFRSIINIRNVYVKCHDDTKEMWIMSWNVNYKNTKIEIVILSQCTNRLV